MANEFKVKKGLIVDGVNTVLDIQGTQGQLFSVTDSLTGDLFSVSDVSGVPIFNVNSSGAIDVDGTIESTGNITCHKDAPKIILKDTGTGNAMTSEFSFHDGNGVSRGYVGYGSSGNSTMYWQNTLGDLQLHTSSALCLTLSGTSATFAGNVDVDGGTLNVGSNNEVSIVSSGSSHFPSLKVNNNGYLGSASVPAQMQLLSSGNTIFSGNIDAGAAGKLSFTGTSGSPDLIIKNNTATSNTAGTATLKFNQALTQAGGKIVSGRDSNYSDGATRDSHLKFYTSTNATDTLVLTLGSNNAATFAGSFSSGTGTITGGGNTLLLKKGTGTPAIAFGGASATPEASALIEGIAGGGLKFYTSTSTAGTIADPGWSSKLTIAQNGASTFASTIAASNFSGSSEGANTGDQTLPTIASLGAVTISTAQTVTGAKDFNNSGNHHNGHLYYRAYSAAGAHYPHFLDGSSASGTLVNWRQYYGTSFKTHTWASDASGNMAFVFQGSIDANGGDITGNNFSGSSSGTNTGDGATNYSVGDEIVAAHEHEEVQADSSNTYKRMAAITIAKNGTASVKFEAYIVSGSYYWSYVIARNNGTSLDLVAPSNQLISYAYTQGLASGVSHSVHNMRQYDVDVGTLVAGDQVELWMRSSTAGGGQVTGNGQQLRAKKFRISASAPTIESNAYLHGTTTLSDVTLDERYGGESWSKYLTFDAANSGGGGMVWNKQGSTAYNRGILSNHSDLQFVRSTDDGNNGSIIKDMIIEADGDVTIGLSGGTHHNYGGRTLAIGGSRATLSLVSTGSLTTIALSAQGTTGNDIHLNHSGATGDLSFYQYSNSGVSMTLNGGGRLTVGAGAGVNSWLSGFDPSTGDSTFKLTTEGWITTKYRTGLASYYPGQGARPIIWADDNGTNIQCWDNNPTDGVSIRSSNGDTRLFIQETGALDLQGTVGQLFSVTNDLTGDLFSVSDISGVPIFNVNASGAVDVDGTFTSSGTITSSADVVAYSDERLKTNIETLDGSKVYDMRGVSFTKDNKKSSGVIAQELEKIAPELVNNDSQFKAVAYGNITGYLIEAIKELKSEIEQLKKQIK